jgi:hypothetical protein
MGPAESQPDIASLSLGSLRPTESTVPPTVKKIWWQLSFKLFNQCSETSSNCEFIILCTISTAAGSPHLPLKCRSAAMMRCPLLVCDTVLGGSTLQIQTLLLAKLATAYKNAYITTQNTTTDILTAAGSSHRHEIPYFQGTGRFITVFRTASHRTLSSANLIQSTPSHSSSQRTYLILHSHLRPCIPMFSLCFLYKKNFAFLVCPCALYNPDVL